MSEVKSWKAINCPRCPGEFYRAKQLARHMLDEHPAEIETDPVVTVTVDIKIRVGGKGAYTLSLSDRSS